MNLSTTTIYTCGPFAWQARIRKHAAELEALGYNCHPEWLYEDSYANNYAGWERDRAMADCRDIAAADILIAFTCAPDKGPARGGRHVEVGMALGLGKQVIIVGHKENVFMHLDQIEFYRTWGACLEAFSLVAEYRWTADRIAEAYR